MGAHAPSPDLVDPHTGVCWCHCDYTRPGLEPWWEEPPANRLR